MTGSAQEKRISEGELLWRPSPDRQEKANLSRYQAWLAQERRLSFHDYQAMHHWSITEPDAFWRSIWDYFNVCADGEFAFAVSADSGMFRAKWFEGARVNFAEHLLRHETSNPAAPAFCHASELQPPATITWSETGGLVRKMADALRALGVRPGDRVVSYMPNIPETAIAMMATVAIGAVWSAAAPEFGARTVIERFAQIEPKILLAADGYHFGGKNFDRRDHVAAIAAELPSLEAIIWHPLLGLGAPPETRARLIDRGDLATGPAVAADEFRYERVPYDHPLWILFSSGTTGIPKAIAHSHAGVLAEHLKCLALHLDAGPESRVFIYTTPGWMMWNTVISTLLVGGCAVLYDGSPTQDGPRSLWTMAEATKSTLLGISPAFVQLCAQADFKPSERFDLSSLETVLLGGSPSGPEIYDWLYRNVKEDLWVCAPSGGTEIVSAFVTGDVTAPVYAGQIQTTALGMDVQVWNEAGQRIVDEVGELVVTRPFPSAPLCFWGDRGDKRYHESYFEYFPGIWRHGDIAKVTSSGGWYIYGRSDSTLNRFGVRIGTGEIYAVLDQIAEVRDSLVVCLDLPDGGFYMPLFIALTEGVDLTPELAADIKGRLRTEGSPRHVPDEIVQVPAIPYTLTGKKMEVPIRKLLAGAAATSVASRDAMADPSLLDWYISFAKRAAMASESNIKSGEKA